MLTERELELLERLVLAQERTADALQSILAKTGRGGNKIVIDGKWKLEGGESINNSRFPIEGEWETKEEAIEAAKEQTQYEKLFLITPQGKRITIELPQ